MIDYESEVFNVILKNIKNDDVIVKCNIDDNDFIKLQYFFTRQYYYAVIVDEYIYDIVDKKSLLEALYYQLKLITVHDLNWDAVQEGLRDALNIYSEFEGLVILFKRKDITSILSSEFEIFKNIIEEINRNEEVQKIKIVINDSSNNPDHLK